MQTGEASEGFYMHQEDNVEGYLSPPLVSVLAFTPTTLLGPVLYKESCIKFCLQKGFLKSLINCGDQANYFIYFLHSLACSPSLPEHWPTAGLGTGLSDPTPPDCWALCTVLAGGPVSGSLEQWECEPR